MGIAALVFGILAIITFYIPFVGIVLGLIGLLLGIISLIKKTGNKAFGIIGTILGGISLLLCAVITILFLFAGASAWNYVQDNNLLDQITPKTAPVQN